VGGSRLLCPVYSPKKRLYFRAAGAMRRRLNPGATGNAYAFLGKPPGERKKLGRKPKVRSAHQEILAQFAEGKW
jgi:hypothetical protein